VQCSVSGSQALFLKASGGAHAERHATQLRCRHGPLEGARRNIGGTHAVVLIIGRGKDSHLIGEVARHELGSIGCGAQPSPQTARFTLSMTIAATPNIRRSVQSLIRARQSGYSIRLANAAKLVFQHYEFVAHLRRQTRPWPEAPCAPSRSPAISELMRTRRKPAHRNYLGRLSNYLDRHRPPSACHPPLRAACPRLHYIGRRSSGCGKVITPSIPRLPDRVDARRPGCSW